MKLPLSVPLIIGGLAFSGCTVGPDYTTPELAAPASFSAATQPASQPATQPVNLNRWWTAFNDPVLNDQIERSVAANHDLRLAAARVREARALRQSVAADRYPTVDGSGLYRRIRNSEAFEGFNSSGGGSGGAPSSGSFGFDRDQDLYQAGFDAAWEIDVFGGIRRSVEAADADLDVSVETYRDVMLSLLAEVARNYIELRGFQRQLEITHANLKTQRETVVVTRAKFNAGLTGELDTRRAEAQVSATESQLPVLESSIARANHRLAVLEGRPPGKPPAELAATAPIPVVMADVPLGLPSDLLRRRPDIRRSERELAAATARIGEATAELYPKFALNGAIGLQSSSISEFTTIDKSHFWSFGPTAMWRLFDGGRLRANIKVQDARTEQALVRFEKSMLIALEDVENALVDHSSQQSRRRSLASAVDSQRKALELANELYGKGLVDFLSVLDVQRSLFLAEDQLARSEEEVSASLVALFKALGGGWEGEDGNAKPPKGK